MGLVCTTVIQAVSMGSTLQGNIAEPLTFLLEAANGFPSGRCSSSALLAVSAKRQEALPRGRSTRVVDKGVVGEGD